MENIETRVAMALRGTGKTLSCAESCTGGRIAHLVTKVSGSSEYFLGGVVSYAVSVKESVLSVPAQTVQKWGVVSAEVAAAMAEGVRRLCSSTYAVSTTGLAEGGDGRYPEGSVWIGVAGPCGTKTYLFQCDCGRLGNIRLFAEAALERLLENI